MEKKHKGKIITDENVALPKIEDFYYNDLVGPDFGKMTRDNIFYVETPPEGEDWIGFSDNRALLSLKATKEAFNTGYSQFVTNGVIGNSVEFNIGSKYVTYNDNAQVKETIESLTKKDAFNAYLTTVGGNDVNIDNKSARLQLLFMNPPIIPTFTTVSIPTYSIIKKSYKEVKDDSNYIFCKRPYPYKAKEITTTGNGAQVTKTSFDISNPAYNDESTWKYDDNDVLYFYQDGSSYRQVISLAKVGSGDKEVQQSLIINKDDSNNVTVGNGYRAKDILVKTLNEAHDIRVVLDINTATNQGATNTYTAKYPLLYSKYLPPIERLNNYINEIKNNLFDEQWYNTVGYNAYGLDAFHRIHGVIYVKVKNPELSEKQDKKDNEYVWWNLNKYIIYKLNADANSNSSGSIHDRYSVQLGPDELKPYTYDYVNNYYVDAFWRNASENETSRLKAQEAIFRQQSDLLPNIAKEDFKSLLYEWTVSLGDVTFFVPPYSIRAISQTTTSRLPLMRAKGTVAKSQEKSQQLYEISLYFNEERGINGVLYQQNSPNYNKDQKTGQVFNYKMNGFRALLAEMKFVPFVPIVNKVFNEDFGVYAVCLESMHVATVDSFPKLLHVTLQLSKFNYQVYMPEIPDNGSDDKYGYNPFSCCINYDTLRYYYQKPIILGDILDAKIRSQDPNRISINSFEFYNRTIFSNRTALLPCHFDDPTVKIYIADEDHLRRLDKIKRDIAARANATDNFVGTDAEIRLMNDLKTFNSSIDIAHMYANMANQAAALADNLTTEHTYNNFVIDKNGVSRKSQDGKSTVFYSYDSEADINRLIRDYCYNPLYEQIKSAADQLKNSQGNKLISKVSLTGNKLIIKFNTSGYIASDYDYADMRKEASAYIKNTNKSTIDPKNIFKNTEICLELPNYNKPLNWSDESGEEYNLGDVTSPAIHMINGLKNVADSARNGRLNSSIDKYQSLLFIYWCSNQGKDILQTNELNDEYKQSMDYESVHSLKYRLLVATQKDQNDTSPIDKNIVATGFMANVNNTFARISVSGIDGSAPQYMGSQDTHITWTMVTGNEELMSTVKSLPELTAYYMRTYRKVLPTYPIKIDSEFTRMMGVTEVAIDDVRVETVKDMPGVYRIHIDATSVDRTLRNKEALKALDVQNKKLDISRLLKYRQAVDIKNYKELDKELAKAEIYPDLELPTMNELGQLGFRYIRYKDKERNSKDFYVDPDFYFVYPAITFGRILLESLRYTFSTAFPSSDISQFIVDTSGSEYEIDNRTQLVKQKNSNAAAKIQEEDRLIQKRKNAEDDPLYYIEDEKSSIWRNGFGSWNIGNKIRCVFMEPCYINDEKFTEKKTDKKEDESDINDKIKIADEGAAKLKQWLIENPISDYSDLGIDETEDLRDINQTFARKRQECVWAYLQKNDILNILQKYYLVGNSAAEVTNLASQIISAAADAQSSITECSSDNKSKDNWYAKFTLTDQKDVDINTQEEFGVYKIKKYLESDFIKLLPLSEQKEFKEKIHSGSSELDVKDKAYVLDPYYRFADQNKLNEYLLNCATNHEYCTIAFTRIVLWYMAVLMEHHIFPSIEYDVKREECLKMSEADLKARKTVNKLVNDGVPEAKQKPLDTTNQLIDAYLSGTTESHGGNGGSFGTATNSKGQDFSALLTGMQAFIKNNGNAFDVGKFYVATSLALASEPFAQNTIYHLIEERNYDELNRFTQNLVASKYQKRNEMDPMYRDRYTILRKLMLSLWGRDIIQNVHDVNQSPGTSPTQQYINDYNTKLVLKAASNPAQYMRDSFYDMVRNDYRGRMLRAFPTFYMIFVDEGREIGLFRLHDNFYNINAVHEIQVVKSRLLAADTCVITLSNMFQTFTTNDEDCTINYKGGLGELWDSFWHPAKEAQKAEARRLAATKINRAKLQTGIRIHVRMGYGANARDLPVVFNGTISEIAPGELVKVVAQGDGVELCNPLYIEHKADEQLNADEFLTIDSLLCGATPKSILQAFIMAKGGPFPAALRGMYRGNMQKYGKENELIERNQNAANDYASSTGGLESWILEKIKVTDTDSVLAEAILKKFRDNPFGLYHFGDPGYTDLFHQGEPAQNLYEITPSNEIIDASVFEKFWNYITDKENPEPKNLDDMAYFGSTAMDLANDLGEDKDNLPFISFKPFGKTIWEIMHICQSVAPDWMVGVRDFRYRSTIFLGKPHYYYAYDYKDCGNDIWIEKRKPYQQWHLYNSTCDIIKNGISASSERIKTNAVGLYEVEGDSTVQKTDQKSMIVNTNYYGKSESNHSETGFKIKTVATGTGAILAGGAAAILTGGGILIPLAAGAIGAYGTNWLIDKTPDVAAYITNSFGDRVFSTKLDESGRIHSHEKIAFRMTVNALKNSMRQMYQGYMIVIGDPSIKPQDRIIINDSYEDVEGMCEVREVVHQLNPYNGFTTTITPDLISAHDARTELIKQNSVAHFIANRGVASLMAWSGVKALKHLDKKGLDVITEIIKKYGLNKKTSKAVTAANATNTYTFAEYMKKFMKYKVSDIAKQYPKLKAIMAAPLVWAAAAAAPEIILTAAASYAISEIALGSVQSFLYRTVRNSQVLTLFPLKKFGMAFVAGVDGHQGSVYGTTQYKTVGPLEQLYARLLSGESAKDAGFIEECASTILAFFTDEDIKKEAAKYKRNEEFITNLVTDPDQLKEEQLQSINTPLLDKSVYLPKTAYGMSLMPRAMNKWDKATRALVKKTLEQTACIDNIQDWIINPNLKNLCYIPDSIHLERMFRCKFVRLAQDQIEKEEGFNSKNLLHYNFVNAQKKAIYVAGIKRIEKTPDGKQIDVLDVPFLSQDAIVILKEICEFVLTKLLNKPDDKEIQQYAKDTCLIISSALQVASRNEQYKSGYHFILTGTGVLGDGNKRSLRNYVEDYRKIIVEKLKEEKVHIEPCFTIDQAINKDCEVGITVHPYNPCGNTISGIISQQDTILPDYKDKQVVNNDIKDHIITEEEMNRAKNATTNNSPYEFYQPLDHLGRAREAQALLTWESVHEINNKVRDALKTQPTGWKQAYYDVINAGHGNHLYERCHIIRFRLAGEQDNAWNLFTGTQQLNSGKDGKSGMLEYENKVHAVFNTPQKKYNGSVLYKVKPVFEGNNLLAKAVVMEAVPIPSEKNKQQDLEIARSAGLPFSVTVYNVQDGVKLNYADGSSELEKK